MLNSKVSLCSLRFGKYTTFAAMALLGAELPASLAAEQSASALQSDLTYYFAPPQIPGLASPLPSVPWQTLAWTNCQQKFIWTGPPFAWNRILNETQGWDLPGFNFTQPIAPSSRYLNDCISYLNFSAYFADRPSASGLRLERNIDWRSILSDPKFIGETCPEACQQVATIAPLSEPTRPVSREAVIVDAYRSFISESDRICETVSSGLLEHLRSKSQSNILECSAHTNQCIFTECVSVRQDDFSYNIKLFGPGSAMATGNSQWHESHVFHMILGFDGALKPRAFAYDMEPLVATGEVFYPPSDKALELIGDHRSVQSFSLNIQNTINSILEIGFKSYMNDKDKANAEK